MPLNMKHPLWETVAPDWDQMQDCHGGERVVKMQGEKYLPPTQGMRLDGMGEGQPGYLAYEAYKTRAVFPNDVHDAIEAMVGVMHNKPPVIKVPPAMEPMLEKITPDGADAATLLRRINFNQLLFGRVGMLLDVADQAPAGVTPYISLYGASSIINWNTRAHTEGEDELAIVVLNETGLRMRKDLSWQEEEAYRILATDVSIDEITADDLANLDDLDDTKQRYQVAVTKADASLAALQWRQPSIAGKPLSKIPFVCVNTQDLVIDPEQPPLLGLANRCLAIYRGEADYRQSLFMQGQDTLVVVGADGGLDPESEHSEKRVGAGARIDLPIGGSAMYIGVQSQGLTEQREALRSDYEKASSMGMSLIDTADGSSQQSGDALRIRVAARTASLNSVARAGAAGLQTMLRMAAEWMGVNPEEVFVEPNLEFADQQMTGDEAAAWASAKAQGLPISWETIHAMLQARKVTTLTYEEEQERIAEEEPMPAGGEFDPITGEPLPPEDELPPEEDEEDLSPEEA